MAATLVETSSHSKLGANPESTCDRPVSAASRPMDTSPARFGHAVSRSVGRSTGWHPASSQPATLNSPQTGRGESLRNRRMAPTQSSRLAPGHPPTAWSLDQGIGGFQTPAGLHSSQARHPASGSPRSCLQANHHAFPGAPPTESQPPGSVTPPATQDAESTPQAPPTAVIGTPASRRTSRPLCDIRPLSRVAGGAWLMVWDHTPLLHRLRLAFETAV
jgi:hypothetical protein